MPPIQFTCPHCHAALAFAEPPPPGAAVRCGACKRMINVRPAAAAAAAAPAPVAATAAPRPAAPVAVPRAPAPAAVPSVSPPPRPAPPRPASAPPAAAVPASSGMTAGRLLAGCAILAVLLLMLGGLALLVGQGLLADRPGKGDKGAPPVAQGPAPELPPVIEPPQTGTTVPPNAKDDGPRDKPPPTPVPPPVRAPKKEKPKGSDGEVDIADVGKPDPTPPPPLPLVKPREETKPPPMAPVVEVSVPAVPSVRTDPKVNEAIDRGVRYLQKTQRPDGSWDMVANQGSAWPTGYAALGGLALLECGVPAKDPSVQRAAGFVRSRVPELTKVYEVATAILFLDRLADPRDEPFIAELAIRLVASQGSDGGWNYDCPRVPPQLAQRIPAHLATHWPWSPARPKPAAVKGGAPPKLPVIDLQKLPADLEWNRELRPPATGPAGPGDNSNTQFALLALWAARRHGLAVEAPIYFAYQRFIKSQGADGGWVYTVGSPTTPAMTCAGMLGLALGHGVLPVSDGKGKVESPAMQKGLALLGGVIDAPPQGGFSPASNVYLLWSIERVAVLADLPTIGGKDWYAWGARALLASQHPDGHWAGGGYTGACGPVDTCLALLFLKRSNLVPDLTTNLRLYMVIRDPGAK